MGWISNSAFISALICGICSPVQWWSSCRLLSPGSASSLSVLRRRRMIPRFFGTGTIWPLTGRVQSRFARNNITGAIPAGEGHFVPSTWKVFDMSAAVKKKISGPNLKLVPPKAPPPSQSAIICQIARIHKDAAWKMAAVAKTQPAKAPSAKPAMAPKARPRQENTNSKQEISSSTRPMGLAGFRR